MMTDAVLALVVIGGLLVVLIVILVVRPRIQRRLYAGTGLEEWREVAAGIAWRDRWRVAWTSARGRATELRLAHYAVRRAEFMIAAHERNARLHFFPVAFVLVILSAALAVGSLAVQIATGSGDAADWTLLGVFLALLVGWVLLAAFWTRLVRFDIARLRRSIALNKQLLNGTTPTDPSD